MAATIKIKTSPLEDPNTIMKMAHDSDPDNPRARIRWGNNHSSIIVSAYTADGEIDIKSYTIPRTISSTDLKNTLNGIIITTHAMFIKSNSPN